MATTRSAGRSCRVLDPRTLGRPVHLIGRYTERLRKELADVFQVALNRRYRAQFEVGEISIDMGGARADGQRWLSFAAEGGRIGFSADRNILLCILAYRYGVHVATSQAPTPDRSVQSAAAEEAPSATAAEEVDAEPETATEERLAARLGNQFAGVIAATIEALQPDVVAAQAATPIEFTLGALAPADTDWTLRVQILERAHQLEGTLRFRLDERWIARLLRGLTPLRDRSKSAKNDAAAQPLASRLQLSLAARLLQKDIALGTLLDLRVGNVIPIVLGATDVLVGDSRLFTASVAEHKGKLCLTSFEDAE